MAQTCSNEAARATALRLAAHAVAAHARGAELWRIKLVSDHGGKFDFRYSPYKSVAEALSRRASGPGEKKRLRVHAEISLAGPIASKLWSVGETQEGVDDHYRDRAARLYRAAHPATWERKLEEDEVRVEKVLRRRQGQVEAVAKVLLKRRSMGARAIATILPPSYRMA